MFQNRPLADAVITSLIRDPRIPDIAEIAVSAENGVVTLRGTVESAAQREAAGEDALKPEGAYEVDNQLNVAARGRGARKDHELRAAALQTLTWDEEIPAGSIDVSVRDGCVTLTGEVEHQYQKDAAYEDVADVARQYGGVGVTNEIRVRHPERE